MSSSVARCVASGGLLLATLVACKGPTTTHAAGEPAASSADVSGLGFAKTEQADASVAATVAATPEKPSRLRTLNVPRASKSLTPSAHFDIDFWGAAVNTHTLLDSAGKGAVPVSEARFLWGHDQLYVAFYAGDLDLEVHEKAHDGPLWKDDSVTLSFFSSDGKKRMISVSPTGVLADAICPADAKNWGDTRCDLHWESHARIGVDFDGTLNKLGDFDEEWNIQFAIPLRSLGVPASAGTRLAFTVDRCDIAFDGQRACGEWGSSEAPGELLLE
jgi:hypothetical protein